MTGIELMKQTNKEAFDDPLPGDLWHEMFNEQLRVIEVNDDGSLFIRHSITGYDRLLKVNRVQFGHMLKYSHNDNFCLDVIRGKSVFDLPRKISNGLFVKFEDSGLSCRVVEVFKNVYVVADANALANLCLEVGMKKPLVPDNLRYPLIVHLGGVGQADEMLKETLLVKINRIFDSVNYNNSVKTIYSYNHWLAFRNF